MLRTPGETSPLSLSERGAGEEGRRGQSALLAVLRHHWPEYLMEATELGLFMLSACFFTALFKHPASPVARAIPSPFLQGALIGVAMGLTAITLIYSPLGKRSGAHFNPSVTLTFLRLGKVAPRDAVFYVIAQFVGGITGVFLAAQIFRPVVAHPSVRYVVTMPGERGVWVAFFAEITIAFLQMTMVLNVSNTPRLARFTGLFAGSLVAIYITFEGPLSGMSMNPARTFGSALIAQDWNALWIYFTAPLMGMLTASEVYRRRHGVASIGCAKLHHDNAYRCIFCAYHRAQDDTRASNAATTISHA